MPRIAAKIEPTMIGVGFLLVAEFTGATVGDAVPKEPVEVMSIESTRLESERALVAGPARTVGPALDRRDDAATKFEVITGVGFKELPIFSERGFGGVGVGVAWGPGLEFCGELGS